MKKFPLLAVLSAALASCGQQQTTPEQSLTAATPSVITKPSTLEAQSYQWVRYGNGQSFTVTNPNGSLYKVALGLNYYPATQSYLNPGTYTCDTSSLGVNAAQGSCYVKAFVNTLSTEHIHFMNRFDTSWSSAYTQAVSRLQLKWMGEPTWGQGYGYQEVYFQVGYNPTDAEYQVAVNWASNFYANSNYKVIAQPSYRKVVYALYYISTLNNGQGWSNTTLNGLRFGPYDTVYPY